LKLKNINLIEKIVNTMDVPFYRKEVKNKNSLRWLKKKLPLKNSEHKHFSEVMGLIDEALNVKG
jgi:hypothetical protein